MGKVAYALRAEFAGTVEQHVEASDPRVDDSTPDSPEGDGLKLLEVPVYSGGVIKTGFDEDLDVGLELEEGDGVIVVDASKASLVLALDEHPALKRVPAPADADAVAGYERQTSEALGTELERRGVTVGKALKDDRVAALERLDGYPIGTLDPDNPPTVESVLAGDYDGAPEEA